MSVKLTCDEATTICDKSQYKEASLFEKLKLGFHLFLCNKCGLYSKQNSVMTKCYEIQKKAENKNVFCLCDDEKKEIEKELKKRL